MVTPKGTLVLIGGAEDKGEDNKPDISQYSEAFEPLEILSHLLSQGGGDCSVEVITTASTVPREIGQDYQEAFRKVGFEKIGLMHIATREEARKEQYLERLSRAGVVFFTGGDQFRLSTLLGGTGVELLLKQRYQEEKNFVLAGTSAGAMVMSRVMLYEGHRTEALLKGDVKTASGLGLLEGCIVDTHFIKRGRIGRLTQAVITNPSCIGIGLGEDTALVVKEGNRMECLGSGMVVILDPADMKHTNVHYAENNTPLCVEHLVMHILARGSAYLLKERQFVAGKADQQE